MGGGERGDRERKGKKRVVTTGEERKEDGRERVAGVVAACKEGNK